ncbi:MAG TPA: hypothetical protein GX699_10745 [Firmicutes bacterium]|nr:hypothetical protein [Bacillota bacterium]
MAEKQTTLTVLNPRGEICPPKTWGLSPRLKDFKNKTIALMSNGKKGVDYLHDALAELLTRRFPGVKIVKTVKPGGSLISLTEEWYPEVAAQCDAFIFAIGD